MNNRSNILVNKLAGEEGRSTSNYLAMLQVFYHLHFIIEFWFLWSSLYREINWEMNSDWFSGQQIFTTAIPQNVITFTIFMF